MINRFRRLPPTYRWLTVLAVLLLGAGAVYAITGIVEDDGCDGLLERRDGQCVGLTDGADKGLGEEIDDLLGKIHKENGSVRDIADRVKIAYMIPVTGEASTQTTASVRHQLEGALIAVHRANTKLGPRTIRFELVVANTGERSKHWQPVVEKIIADERIIAVAGLGASIDTTQSAITRLKAAKVPMIGATITADDLHDIRGGLIRVSPTNENEAKALVQEVPKSAKGKILLLRDADDTDLYAADLAGEFRRSLADLKPEEVPFTYGPTGSSGDPFWQLRARICSFKPSHILFAGRGRQLQDLLSGFGSEACDGLNTTIISGDDAGLIEPVGAVGNALRLGISLRYAGLASPHSATLRPDLRTGYGQFTQSRDELRLGEEAELVDGQSMMAYDAVYTVVQAANNIGSKGASITRQAVASQWFQMNDLQGLKFGFNGASGRISFSPETGNPLGKPIPIIELRPDGTSSLIAVR